MISELHSYKCFLTSNGNCGRRKPIFLILYVYTSFQPLGVHIRFLYIFDWRGIPTSAYIEICAYIQAENLKVLHVCTTFEVLDVNFHRFLSVGEGLANVQLTIYRVTIKKSLV
jgi:hypothetical protein